MSVAERYLLLGLRLGRHLDGLVDAYYGPPELAREAESGPIPAAGDLAAEADGLLTEQVRVGDLIAARDGGAPISSPS